jgi:hypothetical protein
MSAFTLQSNIGNQSKLNTAEHLSYEVAYSNSQVAFQNPMFIGDRERP